MTTAQTVPAPRDADTTPPPVLEISGMERHFGASGGGTVRAVDGVSITIGRGEVVGLVGESGSGKSTVGRCAVRLDEPTAGTVHINGTDVSHLSRRALRPLRKDFHLVFQDPSSSLDPRMTVGQIIAEPVRLHRRARGAAVRERVEQLLGQVGLRPEHADRHPHELSGGQRQRISIARALSCDPDLVVADEPTSALDVSVQASVLNLLADLQRDRGFGCLFITHDLAAVEFLADRIAVMYLGQIVEQAPTAELFAAPKHPYTQALLSAAPVPDPVAQRSRERIVLNGELPSPLDPPPGCRFHTRCPLAVDRCRTEIPALREIPGGPAGLLPPRDRRRHRPGRHRRLTCPVRGPCPVRTIRKAPQNFRTPQQGATPCSPPAPPSRAPSAWCPPPTGSPRSPRWPCWRTAATPTTRPSPPASSCTSSSRTSTARPARCRSSWRPPDGAVRVLCGQGPAPAGATVEHYRSLGLDLVPGTGPLAAAVPGAFDAWMLLLRDHGTRSLADVLRYAIGYAERRPPRRRARRRDRRDRARALRDGVDRPRPSSTCPAASARRGPARCCATRPWPPPGAG